MESSKLLYRTIYRALIEIREQGHKSNDKFVFHVSDLFHVLPLQLERATRGEIDHAEILADLTERSYEKGIDEWLRALIEEISLSENGDTFCEPD